MVLEADIRKRSGNAAFQKGMGLFLQNKVKDFDVNIVGKYEYIGATVEGSSSNEYDVDIQVDPKNGTIVTAFCECPAFDKGYTDICKHCVAVLLKYNQQKLKDILIKKSVEDLSKNNMMSEFMMMRNAVSKGKERREAEEERNKRLEEQRREAAKPKTNNEFLQLMQNSSLIKVLPLVNKQVYGQVHIEPHIVVDNYRFEIGAIEFKIGIDKMYVLKDIFSFAEMINSHENYSYGKKLEFVHSMEAFDRESQRIVELILNWVDENRSHYKQVVYTSYYSMKPEYDYPKLRYIPIAGKLLEDILELTLDTSSSKIYCALGDNSDREWLVRKNAGKRKLWIIGVDGGATLKMEDRYSLQGYRYYITWGTDIINLQQLDNPGTVFEIISCIENQKDNTIFISDKDIPLFIRIELPIIESFFSCIKEDFHSYVNEEVGFKIYLDAPQKNIVSCKLSAVYKESQYEVFNEEYGRLSGINGAEYSVTNGTDTTAWKKAAKEANRDYYREVETGTKISKYFNAYDGTSCSMILSDNEELLYELLTQGIAEFEELGEVYVTDALKRINIISPSKVSVGVSVSENILNLSMTAGEMSSNQLAEILSRYDRKKRYYRLKNGDFVQIAEGQLDTLYKIKESMQLTESQLRQGVIELPSYRAMYLDTKLKEDSSIETNKDKNFKQLIRHMKTVEDSDYEIPFSLKGILRGYQETGFLWLKTLKSNGFGGILADDMGLGKTLQVISFLVSESEDNEVEDSSVPQEEQRKGCTLVISPASLVFNWKSEIEKFAPNLDARMVIGSADERREVIQGCKDNTILLTSYDLLKRDVDIYKNMYFANEVIDEAQYIKNHNTQAAKAVKEIRAGFKMALTGTPVENSLSELHSIFDYIMPGFLYSYTRFRKEIELPIVQNQNDAALTRLQGMIAPFVLRRLKKDVLKDLPQKTEENIFAKITGEQQELYDAHVKRMKIMLDKTSDADFSQSKIQILAELTKLRQLCCDPALVMEGYKKESAKFDLCIEMIANAINGGHKILLFSQFTSMLERIQNRLSEDGISYYSLTGATSKEKRAELVELFQNDDTSVFCISLKAGGTGLNLTAADIVIHYDPWWNVAAQNQATDRAHRIGQSNPVTVYRLIAKGTIEENIIKLQEKKRELADQVIGGDSVGTASFNKDELLELLS